VRSVGSELMSVALVLAVPLSIVVAFPFGAFEFEGVNASRRQVRSAFVDVTPEAEQLILRKVRASWKGKVGGARRLQANIFLSELPEDGQRSVLSVRDRSRPPMPAPVAYERTPFLPSQKAPPPLMIAPTVIEQAVFSREELLKLN